MFHDLTQGILSAVWVDPCLFQTHSLSASSPPPCQFPLPLSHRLPAFPILSLSLSLCSCITLSASLSQSLYTVCYSLAPPPFLPSICIPSLQKRPLKVNVCFHLRSSFSLPVPSCVYLHQTVSQVFPSSYGYPVWLHAHLFFFLTLPHPHGLKSHSDVKRKEEKEEAEEKYGTADAIIQTHTRIVEKLHRIHTRQS